MNYYIDETGLYHFEDTEALNDMVTQVKCIMHKNKAARLTYKGRDYHDPKAAFEEVNVDLIIGKLHGYYGKVLPFYHLPPDIVGEWVN